jgi:hypothetical protein
LTSVCEGKTSPVDRENAGYSLLSLISHRRSAQMAGQPFAMVATITKTAKYDHWLNMTLSDGYQRLLWNVNF